MKLKEILGYIDNYYVDTVNLNQLTETAIKRMLEDLDPHTVYVPAKEVSFMNAPLEGDFEGIGIEFNIFRDTLCVILPLPNSPASEVGIQSGDKIIAIDNQPVTDMKLTSRDVFHKLRGKAGSKVKLTIIRGKHPKPMEFTVARRTIPTYTVEAGYMINKEIGYIKISRFGAKTYDEFVEKMNKLLSQGMKKLVLDLRDNPGGYLSACVKIADDFLPNKKLIVYTDGKEDKFDSRETATGLGRFEDGAVIVLIDEGSASASEIVAGALQDNDRALIVGRRSFGKGLVQKPIVLSDSSELRLTISRYYTPSGRSIQKKYEHGEAANYQEELDKRFKHGEYYHADSIKFDESLKYKTVGGRTVYGGGGIMPDYFVPQDTSYLTPYLNQLYANNLLREFALQYADQNRSRLSNMTPKDYVNNYELPDSALQGLIVLGEQARIKYAATDYEKSKKIIKNQLKAMIARSIWHGEDIFFQIIGKEDHELQEALKHFDMAESLLIKR